MKVQIFIIGILFTTTKGLIIPNYETEPEAALGPVPFPPVAPRPDNTFQNNPTSLNPVKQYSQYQTEENAIRDDYFIIDPTHRFKYIVNPLNNLKIIVRRKPLIAKLPFALAPFTPIRLLFGRIGFYERSPLQFINSF